MRPARALALGVLVAAAVSCKASAPMRDAPGSAPPYEAGQGGAMPGDELDSLEAQLGSAEAELRGLGSDTEEAVTAAGAEPGPSPAPPMDRCERIRGLADRICSLRDRMCTLAVEHDGEARYRDACGRAEQTCDDAQVAADECVPGT